MNFKAYLDYFKIIIENPNPSAPYDDPAFIEYTKLNWARLNRWLKQGKLNEELSELIKNIQTPQHWIVITEPWCGDAAHNVPFFELISALNPLISVEYELRDSPPHRIEQYLSHGSKSIPILIVKNEEGEDLLVWGSRPEGTQVLVNELKEKDAELDEIKVAIQHWYNKDKGISLQDELLEAFKRAVLT